MIDLLERHKAQKWDVRVSVRARVADACSLEFPDILHYEHIYLSK